MAGVVDAVAGKKVEDAAAVFGVQFAASATFVTDVHVQDVEEGDPLRVYELFIRTARRADREKLGGFSCHVVMDAPLSNRDAFAPGLHKNGAPQR